MLLPSNDPKDGILLDKMMETALQSSLAYILQLSVREMYLLWSQPLSLTGFPLYMHWMGAYLHNHYIQVSKLLLRKTCQLFAHCTRHTGVEISF